MSERRCVCRHAESDHDEGAGCMWENSATFPGWFCVCRQFRDVAREPSAARATAEHEPRRPRWRKSSMPEPRYGCRWCPARYRYFKDLEDHANDEHPVEYERAITRANLEAIGQPRRTRQADPAPEQR